MELSIGEACNLACDYCFVDKSNPHVAGWPALRRAVDWFLSGPHRRYTLTFTTMEPFLHAASWRRCVEHSLAEADRRGVELGIITTTNGARLDGEARAFIQAVDRRLWMNASLDGAPGVHDAHRPLAGRSGGPSFARCWPNIAALPRDRTRIICTVSPDGAGRLPETLEFFLREGFVHLDVFPDFLADWPAEALAAAAGALEDFIARRVGPGSPVDLRLLNRLCGPPYHNKILFSGDERFYAYEGVLLIPYAQRAPYRVGTARGGVRLAERTRLLRGLARSFAERTGDPCGPCELRAVCGYPTPLMLWCDSRGLDLRERFISYERIARTFVALAARIDGARRSPTDRQRFGALPQEPAPRRARSPGAAAAAGTRRATPRQASAKRA